MEKNDDGNDEQEGQAKAELLQSIEKVQQMIGHRFSFNQSQKPAPRLP
jgi:hypothetical protein